MAKYQWNNEALKKRAKIYSDIMYVSAFLALAVVLFLPSLPEVVFLGLMCVAVVGFGMPWRLKSQDAKLKKPKE